MGVQVLKQRERRFPCLLLEDTHQSSAQELPAEPKGRMCVAYKIISRPENSGHFKQSMCFPFSALYLNFMLQMVDEVHLQHYLLSSDEVWRDIKGKGKIFGYTQLRVQENEINNTAKKRVYQIKRRCFAAFAAAVDKSHSPLWCICSLFFCTSGSLDFIKR